MDNNTTATKPHIDDVLAHFIWFSNEREAFFNSQSGHEGSFTFSWEALATAWRACPDEYHAAFMEAKTPQP